MPEERIDENSLNIVPFRDSGLVANIFGIDARIFFVFLTLVFIHSMFVLMVCIFIALFFWFIARLRMTPGIFFAWLRFNLGSERRSWQTRRLLRLRGDLGYPRW